MKILKIFGIIVCTTLTIAGITQRNVPNGENNLLIGCVCGIITILLLRSLLVTGPKKEKVVKAARAEADKIHNEMISMIEGNTMEPISNSRILLKKDELAYLEFEAILKITKNKLLGTTGKSGGASVRVSKGLYVRSGEHGSKKIYGDVTTKYPGIFSVTSQRVSFLNGEKGFEIPLAKITSIVSDTQTIVLQQTNRSYILEISNADIVELLIRKLISDL